MGVQRRLGHPRRPRGEQHHGDVGGPGRARPRTQGRRGIEGVQDVPGSLAGRDEGPGALRGGHARGGHDHGRVHLVECGCHLGAAQAVVQGRGDGAEPPARPVEKETARRRWASASSRRRRAATPVAASRPARAATPVSSDAASRRPVPSTTDVPVTAENDASSGPRSQAPPGRRYRAAPAWTNVGRSRRSRRPRRVDAVRTGGMAPRYRRAGLSNLTPWSENAPRPAPISWPRPMWPNGWRWRRLRAKRPCPLRTPPRCCAVTAPTPSSRPDRRCASATDIWTHGEVFAESTRYAALFLERLDPARPPHVGVLLDNTPEYVFCLAGAGLAGAAVVGLNHTRRDEHLLADIGYTDVQLLVTEPRHQELLEPVAGDLALPGRPARVGAVRRRGRSPPHHGRVPRLRPGGVGTRHR